jgi:hypothetical protein
MSKRVVWPYGFTLQRADLTAELERLERLKAVQSSFSAAAIGTPVALRWLTRTELGIPRRPFRLYRRPRLPVPQTIVRTLLASPAQVNGTIDLAFPAGALMFLVSATVQPIAGQSITLVPYDYFGNPMLALATTFTANSVAPFACPGMAGLRVQGEGTVSVVLGVEEDDYANLADWELIQVVGLPVEHGQFSPHYDSNMQQGFVFAPTTGRIAALERMLIAEILRDPAPLTGDPTFPLPPWPAPIPAAYLQALASSGQLLGMIGDCLAGSDDASAAHMQSLFAKTVNVSGITQANLPPGQTGPSTGSSQAVLPVVGVTMMAAGTDSDAATALGYGTIDIPILDQLIRGAGGARDQAVGDHVAEFAVAEPSRVAVWDYMVAAPFILPGGLVFDFAALSQPSIPVWPVEGFAANRLATHAVLGRDTGAQVAVELTWAEPPLPQASGLIVSRTPGTSAVLNTKRKAPDHGYEPYVGLAPDATANPGQSPGDTQPNFKDAVGALPLDGSSTTRYLAAGIDVFGRWSSWTPASIKLVAGPVTPPGLRTISLKPGALPTSGTVVPYTLSIEFAWDWTDRSPAAIRITGKFVSPGTGLGPPYQSGLALSNTGAVGGALTLSWDYTGADPATVPANQILPTITSGQAGTVTFTSDSGQPPANNVMRYLVQLTGLELDFASANDLYLALYAQAAEHVRPGEWSDHVDQNAPPTAYIGRVVRAPNPLPPVVKFTPPSINWTALPDAMQKARGVLDWTADASAAGYMAWESTESHLLQALRPSQPDPDPTLTLVQRGAALKALITANYDASLSCFSRLNTVPLTGSQYEVVVPGQASVLYCYMVSAVSAKNVEAPRPPQIAVFGVPRRATPGQPRLRLRTVAQGSMSCVQVIALPVETGEVPAAYRVYRVRSPALATDAGLMGPPKIGASDPGWAIYQDTYLPSLAAPATRAPTTAKGMSIVDAAAGPSWYPYYYRIDAIGPDDPANGVHAGWSLPSQVQQGYCTPPNPPLLVGPTPAPTPTITNGGGDRLIVLQTDLPIPESPLGPSLVELLKAGPDPANAGGTAFTSLMSAEPTAMAVGALALPAHVLVLPGHPHPPPPPPLPTPALGRTAPDANGHWTLYARVAGAADPAGTYMVRLTDPLGRQTSASF